MANPTLSQMVCLLPRSPLCPPATQHCAKRERARHWHLRGYPARGHARPRQPFFTRHNLADMKSYAHGKFKMRCSLEMMHKTPALVRRSWHLLPGMPASACVCRVACSIYLRRWNVRLGFVAHARRCRAPEPDAAGEDCRTTGRQDIDSTRPTPPFDKLSANRGKLREIPV
jgi:hypothetical protein